MAFFKPENCPKCLESDRTWNLKGSWCIKKGYYKTKWNSQKVPRYKCKRCKILFCSKSHLPNYKQKKPNVNKLILKWYASGVTQRRIAKNLGINRKTVARKFLLLARQGRTIHEQRLIRDEFKTNHIQFDEMETYEHTLAKPISISLAVETNTGQIIDISAASMKSHGRLNKVARQKYGYREDTRDASREDVFRSIRRALVPNSFLITDKNPAYLGFHDRFTKDLCKLIQVKAVGRLERKKEARRNKDDSLWRVNHMSAKLRQDMCRLMRRTWATTKQMWALQAHLDLYIAYNNGYKLI